MLRDFCVNAVETDFVLASIAFLFFLYLCEKPEAEVDKLAAVVEALRTADVQDLTDALRAMERVSCLRLNMYCFRTCS